MSPWRSRLRTSMDRADPRAPPASARIDSVDDLRGIAILAMIAYHFSYDLRFYGVVAWDFEHGPFWLVTRTLIAGTFLMVAGVGLVLADRAGAPPSHFWKRFGVIAACALAVSIGSYIVFPRTFIYFGVLHCIAIASVLAWPLARHPALACVAGIAVIISVEGRNFRFARKLRSVEGARII